MADNPSKNDGALTNLEKAPRAGMQGKVERGAAPTQTLPRPGSERTDVHRTTEQSAALGAAEGDEADTGE